jgi:hypothetical protein
VDEKGCSDFSDRREVKTLVHLNTKRIQFWFQ